MFSDKRERGGVIHVIHVECSCPQPRNGNPVLKFICDQDVRSLAQSAASATLVGTRLKPDSHTGL